MPGLRILIIGAGVSGLALASLLTQSRQDHEITIIERYSALRAAGQQVDLRGLGFEVLKRMGLEQAFGKIRVPETGLKVVDSKGRQWGWFPARKGGMSTDCEVMRGDLVELLRHSISNDRVDWRFGVAVETMEELNDAVLVSFTDGKKQSFDLVVGADGQWSRTRRTVMECDDKDVMKSAGMSIAYFSIPRPVKEQEPYVTTVYMASKHRAIMTRRHSDQQLQVYLCCNNDAGKLEHAKKGDVRAEKEALTEIFDNEIGWETDSILQDMQGAADFYCERLAMVQMDSWSKGRVVLVGDAAYCPTANSGMGTPCAMLGAYVLAGEITKYHQSDKVNSTVDTRTGIEQALHAYEDKFRPYVETIQKDVLVMGETSWLDWMWSSERGIACMNLLAWLFSLVSPDLFASWFTSDKNKDWQMPDYVELRCTRSDAAN